MQGSLKALNWVRNSQMTVWKVWWFAIITAGTMMLNPAMMNPVLDADGDYSIHMLLAQYILIASSSLT